MKKLSILSIMFALTLGFFLVSCGAKKDEALVTDYNAKKTQADSIMKVMDDGNKMMMTDHAAWSAKLDDAAKMPNADTAKIADFKAQMKKMEDMAKNTAMMDSLHAALNMKTETNDQLKAAIASLGAAISACNSSCSMMMDTHKKLGDAITAFLSGNKPAEEKAEKAEKKSEKKAEAAQNTPPPAGTMDMSKHAVKTVPGKQRGSAGSTVKQ